MCILYILMHIIHIFCTDHLQRMHINFSRKIFAQRTGQTVPDLLCQKMYCVLMSKFTRYLCMKVTHVPVTRASIVQTLKLTMMSCENRSTTHVVLNRSLWCSGLSCCKTWTSWIFLLSLRKAGVGADTRETSIWSCQLRIGISVSPAAPAHRYA